MKKIYALLIALLAFGYTAQAQMFSVTFQVDMQNETVGDTVSVAGNFQAAGGVGNDWTPGAAVLTDGNNDDIYELTVMLPAGNYEYKFLNGAAWGTDEGVPGACATNGNRGLSVSGNTTIPVDCFGACGPCATSVDTVMVTFQVDMSNETAADSVTVAGDWQGDAVGQGWSDWTPGISVLTDGNNDDIYELTVMLPEGTYQYKYINGVAWGLDESVPTACNVNNNRELVVSGPGPIVVPVNCFAGCGVCVPPLPPINVTFRVDMSNEIVNVNGLNVAGSFQNPAWDKDALGMLDGNGDDIYEYTESIVPGEYQFKFFNGGSMDPNDGEFGSIDPGSCAISNGLGGFNRVLDIKGMTNDTILPVYEFNTCQTVATSIVDAQLDGVEAYPNPFSTNATVRLNGYDGMPYSIRLVNVVGQKVWEQNEVTEAEMVIERAGLQTGVYFLEVEKNGAKKTLKLIVE